MIWKEVRLTWSIQFWFWTGILSYILCGAAVVGDVVCLLSSIYGIGLLGAALLCFGWVFYHIGDGCIRTTRIKTKAFLKDTIALGLKRLNDELDPSVRMELNRSLHRLECLLRKLDNEAKEA